MLSDKFQKILSFISREEIYVHTDRNDYVAGEDVWFEIYLFDRQSSKPSPSSKIAYFEILNSKTDRWFRNESGLTRDLDRVK